MENELEKKWKEIGSDESDFERKFCLRADFLMNDLCLVAGTNKYRVVDCEVYYKSADHPDHFIDGHYIQLKHGWWYFNKASGIDLTFGNHPEDIHASVLIRAIVNLGTNAKTIGVYYVAEEILNNLGSAFDPTSGIHLIPLSSENRHERIFNSRRFRLAKNVLPKREDWDEEEYRGKRYRFTLESHCPNHDDSNTDLRAKRFANSNDFEICIP